MNRKRGFWVMTVPALAGLVVTGCVTPAQFLDSKQGWRSTPPWFERSSR